MKRKLIRQGGGGYTIYLPKHWVDSRSLQAGDSVEIEEVNNALLLQSSAKTKKETSLVLDGETRHEIYVKLSHIYRMGFDKITVTFSDPSFIRKIARVVEQNLLGFDITERTDKKCVLENITEPTEEKFPVLLRRIFLQIKETHDAVWEDLKADTRDNFDEVKAIRASLDKHVFFCRRSISKKSIQQEHAILHWELLTFLMHIQHGYYYLYEHYHGKNGKVSAQTKKFFCALQELFEKYYKAYFEKNVKLLDQIQKDRFQLNKEIISAMQGRNKDKVLLSLISQVARVTQLGGSPIRALIIDVNK